MKGAALLRPAILGSFAATSNSREQLCCDQPGKRTHLRENSIGDGKITVSPARPQAASRYIIARS